jgi:hypothetical protein
MAAEEAHRGIARKAGHGNTPHGNTPHGHTPYAHVEKLTRRLKHLEKAR